MTGLRCEKDPRVWQVMLRLLYTCSTWSINPVQHRTSDVYSLRNLYVMFIKNGCCLYLSFKKDGWFQHRHRTLWHCSEQWIQRRSWGNVQQELCKSQNWVSNLVGNFGTQTETSILVQILGSLVPKILEKTLVSNEWFPFLSDVSAVEFSSRRALAQPAATRPMVFKSFGTCLVKCWPCVAVARILGLSCRTRKMSPTQAGYDEELPNTCQSLKPNGWPKLGSNGLKTYVKTI